MRNFSLGILLASFSAAAQIPGMDMAVMKKWSDAKVIRYQVTGLHDAREVVVFGDHEGKGDVTDKITADFVWDKKTRKVVGEIKIADAKSEVKNLKSDGTNCPPPSLQGEYEHFQLLKHSFDGNGQIQLNGVRTYPAAKVSQYPASCSQRAIPGGKVDKVLWISIMEPNLLGMPIPAGNKNMGVAADKKSFWVKGDDNWIWTFTPAVVQ